MIIYRRSVINCVILPIIASTYVKGFNVSSVDSKAVMRRNVVGCLTEPIQYMFNGTVCISNNLWITCPVIIGFTEMDPINSLNLASRDNVLWHLNQQEHRSDGFYPLTKPYNYKLLGCVHLQNSLPTATVITETSKAVDGSAVTLLKSFRRAGGSVSEEASNTTRIMGTLSRCSLTPSTVSTPATLLNPAVMDNFFTSFDKFQRKLYQVTFNKLASISSAERHENGISFVQSSIFLYLLLMVLYTEVDAATQVEISRSLEIDIPNADKASLIYDVISLLPVSNEDLKFRWSSRLVLQEQPMSQRFQKVAPALHLLVNRLNGTETPDELVKYMNRMVEVDSAGSMHDTFEEEELSSLVRAVLLSTVCVRAGWRAAPTLLNGTRPFRDLGAPGRTARMIRINDIMLYADLNEWDAEALEIAYSTPGLKLLLVVPRGQSLRSLTAKVAATGIPHLLSKMHSMRVAVTIPLYTLRMTLLLPNKFQAMNISRLVDVSGNMPESKGLRLSHAVQRLMFWAEAGRNAFKDDGIEWGASPELELNVDRPYIFFVRYHNITLLSGNFVL